MTKKRPIHHADLLASAIDDLPTGITRLVIVPDGALHRLRFGLLRPARRPRPGPGGVRGDGGVALAQPLRGGWRDLWPWAALAGVALCAAFVVHALHRRAAGRS